MPTRKSAAWIHYIYIYIYTHTHTHTHTRLFITELSLLGVTTSNLISFAMCSDMLNRVEIW